MTVAITGLTFTAESQGNTPNAGYVRFDGIGSSFTIADFYITQEDGLGFKPQKVHIRDMINGTEGIWLIGNTDQTNYGWTVVAAGDKTPVAQASAGVSWSDSTGLLVDVSAAVGGALQDDDDFIIECWA